LPDPDKAQRFRDAGKDLALATCLCALGIFALVWIRSTVSTNILVGQDISHATLPSFWSSILAFLALLYGLRAGRDLVTAWRDLRSDGDSGKAAMHAISVDWVMVGRLSGTVIALLVYALLLESVPFFVLTTVFLFAVLLIYGQPLRLWTGGLAILGGVCLHALFVEFLKLPL